MQVELPIAASAGGSGAPLLRRPLGAAEALALTRLFKALADPGRLRILSLITARADASACVCELIEPLGLSQATVSHHLKVLREAGLIAGERRGTWVHYSLVPGALDELAALLTPAG